MTDPDPMAVGPPGGELEDPPQDPERFVDPVARFLDRAGIGWKKVWLGALLVYGLGEKVLLPAALGYLNLSGPTSTWRPDLEALVSGFLFAPAMLAAYRWQYDGAHQIFVEFARGESFTDRTEFVRFQRNAARWFRRPWWVLSVVVTVVGVSIQNFVLWNPTDPIPVEPWWIDGGATARVVALVLGAPLWFAIAQIIMGQARLANALRRLWADLEDHYRLTSLGRRGGLHSLSTNLSVLTSIGAIVFLNLVLGMLLPDLRQSRPSTDFLQWALLIWVTYIIAVPGIAGFLLWPAHRVMQATKRARISDVTTVIDRLLWEVEKAVERGEAPGSDEVDELEDLHQLKGWLEEDLPIWPLPSPLRAISWSTLIPIGLTALSMVLQLP